MAELKLVGLGLRSYGDIIFNTDGAHDIGKAGATRPRDLHLSRNALIGGTLGVAGVTTLGTVNAGAASFTTGVFSGATSFATTANGATGVAIKNNIGTGNLFYFGDGVTNPDAEPTMIGYPLAANNTLYLIGAILAADDTGVGPAVTIDGRRTTGAITTRNLFGVSNNGSLPYVRVAWDGALSVSDRALAGTVSLAGGGGPSGRIEFHGATNRLGYIGNAADAGGADGGTIPYVAGTHAFTGAQTLTGNLTVGASTFVVTAATGATTCGALTTNGGLQTFLANDSAGAGFRYVVVPNA